jgi:hypothetical protein
MIKKFNDFIVENINESDFNSCFNKFMNIYENKIVPKIGEVKEYRNFMLSDILSKTEESDFHLLRNQLKEHRNEFHDCILDLYGFSKSFSKLACSTGNPDSDFEEIQKVLNRSGFTLDVIDKLFDSVVSVFLSQNFHEFIASGLDDQNGYVDLYLYKLNEKLDLNTTVWLGGGGWGDALRDHPDEEFMIKYAYGYHKTPYGKLFLEQIQMSKEEFVETAYQYLKDYLKEYVNPLIYRDIVSQIVRVYGQPLRTVEWTEKINIDNYITIDDDRFFISYLEMCEDFNKETEHKYEKTANPDWFKEIILSNMNVISNLNVQDTGEELIFNE